jgi:hypothetical protein
VTANDRPRIGIETSPQDTDLPTLDATWERIGRAVNARLGVRPLPDLMTMRGPLFGGMMGT